MARSARDERHAVPGSGQTQSRRRMTKPNRCRVLTTLVPRPIVLPLIVPSSQAVVAVVVAIRPSQQFFHRGIEGEYRPKHSPHGGRLHRVGQRNDLRNHPSPHGRFTRFGGVVLAHGLLDAAADGAVLARWAGRRAITAGGDMFASAKAGGWEFDGELLELLFQTPANEPSEMVAKLEATSRFEDITIELQTARERVKLLIGLRNVL